MYTIKLIRTKTDYKNVIKRIDELIMILSNSNLEIHNQSIRQKKRKSISDKIILKNPKKGTAFYDELDALGTVVAKYEEIHFPIDISTDKK